MSKKWKNLTLEFQSAEGRHFERMALPLIRAIWKGSIIPQSLQGTYDKNGIDIVLCGKNSLDIKLAVQCKGFAVKEHELSDSQIRQCKKSIEDFKKSGLKAENYLLLHNRIPKNDRFRAEVQKEIDLLVSSGQVKNAFVWGYQKLMQEAGKKIGQRCEKLIQLNSKKADEYNIEDPIYQPLEKVPYQVSKLVVVATSKLGEVDFKQVLADASVEILEPDVSNICLVLANAGYGKTTTALRTFSVTSKKIYYLSAAKLPPDVNTKDGLIKHLVNIEDLWDDTPEEDIPVLQKFVGPEIDRILNKKSTGVILILDALDESVYFNRRGGLQQMFNQIRDYKVPVILLARAEFWEARQQDFTTSYGIKTANKDKEVKKSVKVVRLMDWNKEQIKALAVRYKNKLSGKESENILEFIKMVDSNEYEKFYGDIPKRPLFLRYILESVAEQGIKPKGKAKLFMDWVELKIRRDVLNPIQIGGLGRPSVLPNVEETETLLRLAFNAMKIAASKMTTLNKGVLEITSSCNIDSVLFSDERLKLILDPTGLFLHSLLIPNSYTPEKLEISFAHRTYQEFFLALFIRDNADFFSDVKIPETIKEHLTEIKNERL